MMINPFELHPETPCLAKQINNENVTIAQLKEIVDELTIKLWESPDRIWGHSRVEIALALKTVVHEAEKIVNEPGD